MVPLVPLGLRGSFFLFNWVSICTWLCWAVDTSLMHTPAGEEASQGTRLCATALRQEHHLWATCVDVLLGLLWLGFSRELCTHQRPFTPLSDEYLIALYKHNHFYCCEDERTPDIFFYFVPTLDSYKVQWCQMFKEERSFRIYFFQFSNLLRFYLRRCLIFLASSAFMPTNHFQTGINICYAKQTDSNIGVKYRDLYL